MENRRIWKNFSYHGANFRISSSGFDEICREITVQRTILSRYIEKHPDFLESMVPVPECIDPDAPDIVRRMHTASLLTGTGPMAAVAGVNAQIAAEKAVASGADEAIVENGGDIYLFSKREVILALHSENTVFADNLAVRIKPEIMPLAVCSSSGTMGHSKSFGRCDLATVVSVDAALADAAATQGCNMVKKEEDIQKALDKIMSIKGVLGILVIKNDKIGIAGRFPELVKNSDIHAKDKVTKDRLSF